MGVRDVDRGVGMAFRWRCWTTLSSLHGICGAALPRFNCVVFSVALCTNEHDRSPAVCGAPRLAPGRPAARTTLSTRMAFGEHLVGLPTTGMEFGGNGVRLERYFPGTAPAFGHARLFG